MKHDNLKRTVYHEAGHAVMDVLLGLPFVKVSIEMKQKEGYQVEQGRAQRMTYYYTDGVVWNAAHTDAVNAELLAGKLDLRQAIAAMAGPQAEVRLVGKLDPTAQQAAQTDMQHITAACRAALAFGKSIEQVPQTQMEIAIVQAAAHEADRLLKANWGTVEKVATALLQRKTLTRKQVMQIVKLAVENIPPQGEHNEA